MQTRKKVAIGGLLLMGIMSPSQPLWNTDQRMSLSSRALRNPAGAPQCSDLFVSLSRPEDPLLRIRHAAIAQLFHRPSLLLSDHQWYARFDRDQTRAWITGASHISRGVTEVYIGTPERISENESFLLLLESFRQNGLDIIHPQKAGLAITIDSQPVKTETYQVISLSSLKNPLTRTETLEAQENLPKDFFDFVFDGYRKRMKIDEGTIRRLRHISAEVEDRTLLFVKTKESYVKMNYESAELIFLQDRRRIPTDPLEAARILGRLMPEHFTLEAGASVVLSQNAGEKLPLELFTGFEIPRTGKKVIAEVGRFFVDKPGPEEATTSTRIVGVLASLLQRKDVSALVIEADAARARLFSRLGFKPIHQRTNFAGRTEYIMEAEPSIVVDNTIRLLLEQLTPTNNLPIKLSPPTRLFDNHEPKRYLSARAQYPRYASLGPSHDLMAVLTQVNDILATRFAYPVKRSAIELLLRDADELTSLSSPELKLLTAHLLKNGPDKTNLQDPFIAWLKSTGRDKLLNTIYPAIRIEEFCNQNLKSLRDNLWTGNVVHREAVNSLIQAISEQHSLTVVLGNNGVERFAEMLLDPANKNIRPFEIAKRLIREKIAADEEAQND